MRLALMSVMMAAVASTASAVPISYSGGTYTQDFNGLPTNPFTATITGRGPHDITVAPVSATGMTGWTFSNPTGSSANTEFRAHNGSLSGSSGRGVISYGTNGSNERALGVLPTSNQISRFGVEFTNNTGVTVQEVSVSFTGEQWRRGGDDLAAPEVLTYDYLVSAFPTNIDSALFTNFGSYSAPNTDPFPDTDVQIDGNNPANQVPVSETLTNLNWLPGATLFLRWSAVEQQGQDDGLGIDNLSMTAVTVPEPASAILAIVFAVGAASFRRRRLAV